jgi:hypothetical protein
VSGLVITGYVRLLDDILPITESTSAAISATFGYLANHQDDQEKAYLEIQKAIPKDREPVCIWFGFKLLPYDSRIRYQRI